MVRGPFAASRESMARCPAARRSFSIFSKAATSGFESQMVGWETVARWAERTAANKKGRQRKIARRAASNMREPRELADGVELLGPMFCLRGIVDDGVRRCQAWTAVKLTGA